jgi:hypothetical protein
MMMHGTVNVKMNQRVSVDVLYKEFIVSVQQLHGQQLSTYAKPEAANAVLGS